MDCKDSPWRGVFRLTYNEAMRGLFGRLCPCARFPVICLALSLATLSGIAMAQSQNQLPRPPLTQPTSHVPSISQSTDSDQDAGQRRAEDQALKQRNLDRQKRLVADTDKLLQLAQQLNDEMDQKGTSSIAMQKKVEEIEKLAKSVRERMKAE